MQKRLTLWDALPVLTCVILALAVWLIPLWQTGRENGVVVITCRDGRQTERYSLSENRQLTLHTGEYTLEIVIEDGKVYVAESDCPDGICVSSGTISRPGETLVCAPAGVSVKIVTGGEGEIDAVLG